MRTLLPLLALLPLLGGCRERFSPDTYATRAVQQADKVEQGVIVQVRRVQISAEGSTGAATGAAAGGVIGAAAPGGGLGSALGGVGGALVGGLLGTAAEHTAVDQAAWEYIVRTRRDELVRVTQQDRQPQELGARVLVITGSQARIIPDQIVAPPATGPAVTAPPVGTTAPVPEVARDPVSLLPPEAAARLSPAAVLGPIPAAAVDAIDPMGQPLR